MLQYVILIAILLVPLSLHSVSKKPQASNFYKEFHFKLGVDDAAITECYIPIPSSFSKSFNISNKDGFGQEFIPSNETFDAWTEIITVMERIMDQPKVVAFMSNFHAGYEKQSGKVIWQSGIEAKKNIQWETSIVEAPAVQILLDDRLDMKKEQMLGKKELVATKAFQGDFSLITVQYTIRFDESKTSTKQKEALKQKLLKFLETTQVKSR